MSSLGSWLETLEVTIRQLVEITFVELSIRGCTWLVTPDPLHHEIYPSTDCTDCVSDL